MLELRAISKRLGDWSMHNLDLKLEPGEYFVLLGPSGVGKTVTLELIAGLHNPDSGAILWKGEDLTRRPPEDRPFGIVYQDCALFPHLSVAKNIAYGPKVSGVPRPELTKRIEELAELMRITDLLDRDVQSLSGGEEQRVALARSLATRPQLLLLDEPLSALDASIREYLRDELKRIHRESGTTFLHVTHAKEEARHLADRVGVMLDQRLVQIATPEDLFHHPTNPVVARFLGLKNLLPVTDATTAGRCRVHGQELVSDNLRAGISHVWLRPEEVTLSASPPADAPNVLRCRVQGWQDAEVLVVAQLICGTLTLEASLTYSRFTALHFAEGDEVYASFGDSAIHGF
ncbi:MAG: ATP-binding cassette domain-containing protein [bacterium]